MRSRLKCRHLMLVAVAAAAATASCACRADEPVQTMTAQQVSAKLTSAVGRLKAYSCEIEWVGPVFTAPEMRFTWQQWWQKPDLIRAEFEDFPDHRKEIHAIKGSTLFRFLPTEGRLIEIPGYREWVRKKGPDYNCPNTSFHYSVIHSIADLLAAMAKSGADGTRVTAEDDGTVAVEGNWPEGFSLMGPGPPLSQGPEEKVTLMITLDMHTWLPREVRASAAGQKVVLSVSQLRVDEPQPESFFEPGVGVAKERIVRHILRAEDLEIALSYVNLPREVTLDEARAQSAFELATPEGWGEPVRVDFGLSGTGDPERDRSEIGLVYRIGGSLVMLEERRAELARPWYGGAIYTDTRDVDGVEVVVSERARRDGWRSPAECEWRVSKGALRFNVSSDDLSLTELFQLVEPFIKQTASGEEVGASPPAGSGP
jgi:hypothetical protein